MDRAHLAELVAARLRDVPDFPKPGVVFKDFTPLLADSVALRAVVDDAVTRYDGKIDLIAGFNEFFGDMKKSDRQQPWGATLRLTADKTNPAALFEAETYYGKPILQVKTVPAQPGFVGKVYVTVEDLTARGGVRTTSTTFSATGTTYIGPNAIK